ncbi:MAG: hypothetical protein ACW967_09970 [Candidatus Hodarchaeales archaeon]|jgi:GTPase SAR1 family protein
MVFLMKIVVVGDEGIWRRSILKELEDSSDSKYDSHGFDSVLTMRNLEGRELRSQIWVINADRRFLNERKLFYIGALGIVIIFDANHPETLFSSVDKWIHEIWEGVGNDIPIVLLGNSMLDEISSIEMRIKVNFYIKQLMINEKEGVITLRYIENKADSRQGFEDALKYLGLQYFYNFERKKR